MHQKGKKNREGKGREAVEEGSRGETRQNMEQEDISSRTNCFVKNIEKKRTSQRGRGEDITIAQKMYILSDVR
jgi:hypothetical protein